MAKVKKIVRFLEEENPRQAVERLKKSGCRLCTISEIFAYWKECRLECSHYAAIVCLHEESFFGDNVFCSWCGWGNWQSNNIYTQFSPRVDTKHGILVEVDE